MAILGPVEVRDGDRVVPIAGTRLRRLLVRLAVDAGRAVSAHELVDAVWQDDPPADVTGALQTLVSRLRRALGDAGLVHQVVGGYRLELERSDIDVHQFAALGGDGRAALASGDPDRAAELLRAALALWRGPALLDAGDADYAHALTARYDDQRLDAVSDRVDADLQLGRAATLVGELEELSSAHPLRERLSAQLMQALAAAGRPAEALTTYEQVRSRLADQLGTDPSPALQAQHLLVLRGEQSPGAREAPAGPSRRTNLHTALTSFIGRDHDAKRVDSLIESGRLTTIVGAGGAGKTRLSVEVGSTWVERLDGGVWFVPLAPVTDEVDIAPTMLGSLGLRENNLLERQPERMARDAMERLLDALADSVCLLVVDNCEHLIDGVAAVVDRVLASCPRVRVLATSREPLGIDGEALCALTSLALPEDGVVAVDALSYASVQLLAERGAAARAEFVVDERTVASCVKIVRRLDGLPLAIELAAARLRVLPVDEIAARLSDRFALLTGGKRTALPRHRTLRAVVQWSWDLLAPGERLLADRLAVFPAGASLEGARAVCAGGGISTESIPDLLSALVDKSLLQVGGDGELRYRMLETIREFGIEQLVARGEIGAVRRAHADHFAALALEADSRLRTGDQLAALAVLQRERDNVLAALRYLGDSGDAAAALSLSLALTWYWTMIGAHGEAATWLAYALAVPGEVDPDERTVAEGVLAISAAADQERGGQEPATRERVLERWRPLNERLGAIDLARFPMIVVTRPMLAFFAGEEATAQSYFDQALTFDDPWVRATARMFLAHVSENDGDLDGMRSNLEIALEEFGELGDRWGLSSALGSRGYLRMLDGDLDGAVADYERAIDYMTLLGAADDAEMVRLRLLGLHVRRGDLDTARRAVQQMRETLAERQSSERMLSDIVLAGVALELRDETLLNELLDSSASVLEGPETWNPMVGHARALMLTVLATARTRSGDLAGARDHLVLAHEVALGTRDKPIISMVGVAIAELLLAQGHPREAAEVLGAAGQLRGSDDLTDVTITRVRTALLEGLGGGFDTAYARGRGLTRETALARLAPAHWVDSSRAS